MKSFLRTAACVAPIFVLAMTAPANAKTATECEKEWRADKAANQAKGITEKAYVEKCRSADNTKDSKTKAADKPKEKEKAAAEKKPAKESKTEKAAASTEGKQKTVKACEDEWRADKAANQAKGITEKAYVEKCRAGTSNEAKTAPAAVEKKETAAPMAPKAPDKPAAPMAAPKATAAAPASGNPTGANQYAAEAQAKAHCPRDTVVWSNLDSKIYHFAGHSDYGHTKIGAYMCEKDAMSQGMRAAKNEKRPGT